jgi:protein-disulfide isomerase
VIQKSRFSNILPLKNPVIVEFMDYQCPPCRVLDNKFPKDITRIVRHLPLKMHPRAMFAAILAEKAHRDSKLDSIHSQLLNSDLSVESLKKLATDKSITSRWEVQAKSNIAADMADAKKIGVQGTPTMIVCLPSGEMYQASSLSQVKKLIR